MTSFCDKKLIVAHYQHFILLHLHRIKG